ncbi:DUF5694 domain-containing protein [Pontimicrobium sp. SW4]|uniref:DUF5694 domain-containing protein n=1 Tax=Pontimicrobium sp. SW4 TaxID=3153519 RepID=A0AAU7BUJ8_9FLAO
MKKSIFSLFTFLLIACNNSNDSIVEKKTHNSLKPASEFYSKERAQVLVVGTFHFNYPGLDKIKTEESDKIDVLKEPKKTEVTELVEYIKKFKPTKIAIEAHPGYNWNTKFKEYKSGKHREKRDERYQLAMRIANDVNIDTLYTVDATALSNDLWKQDSTYYKSLTNKIDRDLEDPYWEMAKQYFDYREKQMKKTKILDVIKNMNTREGHNTNFGLYLTGSFATGEGQGADNFSMWWYNRNARIFANIVNITESPNDRILVIFGNGHAAILRQFFEASPQYDFVELSSLEEN